MPALADSIGLVLIIIFCLRLGTQGTLISGVQDSKSAQRDAADSLRSLLSPVRSI